MILLAEELLALTTEDPKGCDTSFHQKDVDWRAAREDGVIFAWIRAGQRGNWPDKYFVDSWANAKLEQIVRGFYWVWDQRDGATALDHAGGVVKAVPLDDQGELPPCLDLEVLPVDWDELHRFLLWLEEWTGKKPIIYTGSWFMHNFDELPDWLADYEYWLTGYNDVGPSLWGKLADLGVEVVCWQQANNWQVDWTSGLPAVDRNYWIGDLTEYIDMGNKVVDYDKLTVWLEANAYELDEPIEPPVDPPIPVGDFHDLYWPSAWLPPYVTQHYARNRQFYQKFGLPGHEGIDMRAPDGYDIYSVFEGEVYRVEQASVGAYGIQVRVKHVTPEGIFKTVYAHLKRISVAVGDTVHKGTKLGDADDTGNSAGSHLHLTMKLEGSKSWLSEKSTKPNEMINPTPYFPQIFKLGSAWKVVVPGNFRTAPVLASGNVIRLIRAGEIVNILEHRTEWLDWWKIEVGNTTGFFWEPGYKLDPL